MTGSEYVRRYARSGLLSWEAAAVALARAESEGQAASGTNLTPWPWVDLNLTAARADGGSDRATLRVMSDVLAIGPFSDHVRLPLSPGAAQSICNLFGWLLPTPWLVYQIWRASPYKLAPISMVPNRGADLYQYADHSALIDRAIDEKIAPGVSVHVMPSGGVAGIKKSVVVSDIMQPGKVVIFGWYQPPPHPDVYSNGLPMKDPNRQPWQPKSNVHDAFYVDYSHGIRPIAGTCIVNGQPMATVDLYTHPTLSRLVSNETNAQGNSALRMPRYPAAIPPRAARPASAATFPAGSNVVQRVIPTVPPPTTAYLDVYLDRQRARARA